MLICPICQSALTAHENSLRCIYQHSFDRARQGYINLLPVQHKNSRAPGDNPAMVQARRNFLSGGHYAPLAERFAALMKSASHKNGLILVAAKAITLRTLPRLCPTAKATP